MYISQTPNVGGAYSAPQSNRAEGMVYLPDDLLSAFIQYNGFVNLTVEDGVVTAITENTEARSTWLASLPEPTTPAPTALEQIRADVDYLAAMQGVTL